MNITIVNISNAIAAPDFNAAIAAINTQIQNDFAPEWARTATLTGTAANIGRGKAPIQGTHDAIIYVGTSSEDPTTGVENALGYHSDNHFGTPYGFIYLDVVKEAKENWTVTLSHEALELLADPSAAAEVLGPAVDGSVGQVKYAREVCDPTQGDSYVVGGVDVSNFVGRAYFGLSGGSGATNFLKLDLLPFGVRPGGYFQYRDDLGTRQKFGSEEAEAKFQAKEKKMEAARRIYRASMVGGLRVTLAGNPALRQKVRRAAALAAFNALRDADVSVTPAPGGNIRADTIGDIANIATTVATVASLF